ncbi:GNAT family N-acetyltransferase [Candidatus Sumerlaeota bacterium]|nr:GNAT family N-acetyltransferase [Candidatus Sumerlaeota bacterium]
MAAINLQPFLRGEAIELRPLHVNDWDALYAVACDPLIWEQHPARDRYKEEVFRQFFDDGLECGGALAAVDRATGRIIGSSRYFGYDAEQKEVEIGWTFLARSHWGGPYNREMKRLMLDHAFQFVDRVVFLIGENNMRSRRAIEKIGATLRGTRTKTDKYGNVIESLMYVIAKKDHDGLA